MELFTGIRKQTRHVVWHSSWTNYDVQGNEDTLSKSFLGGNVQLTDQGNSRNILYRFANN